ncbi:MAG: prepilin-type N-terminal cleavage/methylation domain-containing protein [Myxococcota bacterium]|nr:prepilin-type N-terminal cleavage/methylation domain-containing protein [Myxococcota bacterium]
MKKTLRNRKGFTLIELMIVVAIIGILAAIAIPNFLRFQLKSKTSEGKVNLAAIRTAEESYLAEFGNYVAATVAPTTAPGSAKQPWPAAPAAGFETLGWSPEGAVFFQYAIAAANGGYTATALADLDADTTAQVWGYAKPQTTDGARVASAAHTTCVVGDLAADNQVGACDADATAGAKFGQSVF